MPKYKPLYSLYKGLRESKYDVPDSYVSFQKTLTQPGNAGAKSRRGLYQSLKDSNYDVPDTYEDFYKNLFVPVNSTTSRALKIGENPNTPTVNRYRQKMFDSVDPNKNGLNALSHRAVGQAVRATNNVRKPVTAKVVNQKGKPTGEEFAITPAKTVEDLDREYAQAVSKNWENELHDQMDDADRDAAKISDMFKSFIGSTDEVGSVWGNMTRGGGIAGTPHSVTTNNGIMENTEARQILAAGDYNRKRRELLQLEQDSRNGAIFDNHSFFRGMYDAAKDTGFLTGGASDLINAGSLLATKQDLDNGIHTEAGDMLMQQAVKNSNAQSQYGDNQGWMYTGGVITTNMAPFMVQIGSAGFSKGMSTSIGKVVQGAASKVALGTMEKATGIAGAHIANYIGKVTGLTTKAFGKAIQYGIVGAAQANTVGLGNVANDVINRYTGQVYQDEQGNYKFGTFDSDGKLVHEGGEDFLTALVKGETAQTIEFATELAGGGIDAVGTALKNFVKKGGKEIIKKYNMKNVSKVIDFLLNNKVSKNARYLKAGADRTLGKVEVNSIVGESLEEELGIIANTVFTGDNKISDLWDEKQQSQIWGGMLLSIGLMKGAVAPFHAYNAKQYYSYKHKLDKADVNLSQLLGKEKWEELRNQIDATTNDDMPEMVNKINRDVALGKNRQPVREYIQNLLIMRGYDIGNMLAAKKAVEDKGEGVSVKNMEKNQAYQQGRDAYGYDTHEIQLDQEDKQKSLAQLLGISEQQLASMSDEELEALSGRDDNIDRAIYDYQLSTARYEGVIDNARDQIDLEVQRAAQAVDMYTDKSRNTIRNATIKATGGLEDYGVYIINGNIATHEDGSIDISNSDDMILYYDPTTNTVEHADAMMFAELGSEENADEVRSQAMADAKEKAIKETTGIIDGVVEVGTQFKTVDADGTEHTYEVLADNGDGTAMITIDGNIPTELVKGENVNVPVSFEELQKMKDESDQQRLQAAKAQREQMEKERAEQQMQAQTTQAENPAQEDNIQSAPIEDNLDYSDIIRKDGKVQMVDVSDKDGNNLFPDAKDVFYIQGNKMRTKFAYIDANGELKTQSFPTGLVKIKTRGEVSVDDYKKYRNMILSAESSAMPESSMIEDNSGEESDEDSQLANLGLPKGSEIWMSGDGFGRPKENTLSKVVGIDEQGSIILEDKDGKKWSASFDYINNHRELPPLDENTNIVNEENNQSESNAEENTPSPEQTPAMTLEDGTIVPMLEDGNPDFSKLTAAQTAELYDTQFGDDADSIVSGYVSDAKKALDKASNMTVKGKTFVEQKAAKDAKEKAIADAQAAYDSAIAIRDAYNERQLAKVEDTAEGRKELIEKARRKFARLKSAVKDDTEAVSQLYRDTIGSLLHRLYDGTGIDVTDTIPLTAEEYVTSNLGAHSLNYEGTETSKGVKQETGLSREDFAKTQLLAADGKGTTIDALVHSLWENRPSNLESLDTQEIRNALLSVITSGFKASEARNYIENLRIAQAENILEEQKKAADNAAFAEEQKAKQEEEEEKKAEEKIHSEAFNNIVDLAKKLEEILDNPDNVKEIDKITHEIDELLETLSDEEFKEVSDVLLNIDEDLEYLTADEYERREGVEESKKAKAYNESLQQAIKRIAPYADALKAAVKSGDKKAIAKAQKELTDALLASNLGHGYLSGQLEYAKSAKKKDESYSERRALVKPLNDAINAIESALDSALAEAGLEGVHVDFTEGGHGWIYADKGSAWSSRLKALDNDYRNVSQYETQNPISVLSQVTMDNVEKVAGIIKSRIEEGERYNSDEYNDEENEKINEQTNENINAPEQNKFPDKLREGSKAIEVPEDATDENPLGLQLSEDKVPFEIEGGKSGETYNINDNEDRQRLINDNKVDDKDILDIDMPKHVHKAIKELCKKMGLKVQFLYMGARSNGWIENGTMYLALDTEKATQFVFGHEMTHAIKQKNPEAYKELVKVAMAVTTRKKFEEDLAKVYQNYYGISGYNNIDDYVEEVVADNLGKFINDFDLAQKFSLRLNHPVLATILHAIQKIKSLLYGDFYKSVDALERIVEKAYVDTANGQVTNSETGEDVSFSLRQKPEPKKKGIGYKVFVLKDGKLYPPMVANPDGAATPVGVWLDADAAPIAGESKTGRPQVKQGGKGTQGGSGKLAYRPGWHLGVVPYAIQFNRKDAEGNKTLFPKNFVFAEVEYAADVDYQEEARQEGINPSGKYQHSLAGLKHLPTDGYYMYRTNPNPETDPWVITGAMKVNRILTRAEQAELVKNAGREPQQIQEGDIVTDDVVNSINQEIADAPKFSLKVYHGSGADFTEFDFDHMGEGAGSQAFGWGGYVTSSKKIGKDYARLGKETGGDYQYMGDTKLTSEQARVLAVFVGLPAYKEYSSMKEGVGAYIKSLRTLEQKGGFMAKHAGERIKVLERVLPKLDKVSRYDFAHKSRNLYEVDIPEDNGSNYIEFYEDATPEFKEQIKSLLANGLPSELKEMPEYKEAERKFYEENGTDESFEKSLIDDALFELERRKSNGDAYNALSVAVGDKLASKILSSLGYTGIKYPAGTIMGGAEENDTNYVIFKPEDMKITEHTKFSLRLKSAIEETETNPSDAQKESGNYKKGHIKFGGYDYTIENPKGSTRSGKDADGKEWKVTMHDTYGYIRGKFGKDGDHLDMFINDKADLDNWNGDVFVVDQVNPDGSFDEHKVMYGYDSMDDAKKAYLANYSKGWQGLGNITGASKDEFDKWLDTSNRKLKPFADYAKVKFSLKDIKPVGVGAFGNIYNQFRGNAKAAIEFLKKVRGGEAVGALHHKDIGDIDLVWGKEGTGHSDGYGLSKLVKYHPEVLDNLQEILNDMRVVSSSKNRVNLESETHKAGVRLTWDGERKSWLLTAFKKETSASDKRTDTAATSLEGDTALSQTEGSAAKIDNSSETAKGNDEKFSLKDEKTLAGVHNISEEKLLKAIKQGGLANPSVAVIDSSRQDHKAYGGISLILPSDKIAKRTGKNAGTWQGDAYTPTYPEVEKQMSNKGAEKSSSDVLSVPKEMQHEVRNGIDRCLNGGDANSGLKYLFLHEKGVAPEPKKIQPKFSDEAYNELKLITAGYFNIYGIGKADAQKVLDMYIEAKFDGDKDLYEEKTKAWLERNKSIVDAGAKGGMRYAIAKENVELYDEYGFNYKGVQTFVRDVEYDHRKSGVDTNATLNEVEDYIKTNNLTDEFNTWLEGKEKEYGIKEVIFDGFTPSGNRRYVPNTLENVSKLMKKQGRNGATGAAVSFQNFAARLMPSYGTLKDIRSKKGLLTSDREKFDKFREKWSNIFFELGMKCQPDATGTFDDYGLARLSEAAMTSDPQAYLKKEYNVDFSDEDTKRLKEMVKAIKEEHPAMYFETKFERPVRFDEFSAAVVPTTTKKEVKEALKNAGVSIFEYDEKSDADRKRAFNEAINSSDNIRFSLAGERGAADMAEDLKSLNTPDEVDDAIKTAIDDMPSGWKMANKKMIHIAQALGENRKAEIAGEEPKFSLKDGTLIKAGTYFSGGGLVEEGLKGIIDPVVAVEYDEKISGVYRNNFGQHIVTADVRDVDPKELVKQIDGEVEYFHASPVCKNYSQAKSNHAEVELDKETAASTAEFINAIKPKVVTIENVKGYKDSEAMKTITDALDANGYTWDADVYNAADYGGYTNRERLIIRAVRDGKLPEKPKKMAHKSGWYEAVADIIPTLTEKKNGVAPWMDIRLKADGIDWRHIDKPLYVMGSAYADEKVPHAFADELLPTLRTKSGDVIVMPDGKVYRAMGRVLARVSGVSDDYKMPFSENLSHTIIGNGIPTQLTEHVIAPLLTGSDPKFSIRTYHGTGASFDKFDFSHMGEGEGSQAFGWGGYVTNSKDIAEDYTRRAKIRKDNGGFEFVTDMSANNKDMVRQYIYKHKDVNKGLDAMRKDLSSALEMFPDDDDLKELSNILAKKNEEIAVPDNIAYLYDVDIPDDNGDYLDWDAPLTDKQKNTIIKELRRLKIDFADFKKRGFSFDGSFGGNAYDFLMYALRKTKKWKDVNASRAVSKFLSSIGFTGIKYKAGTIFGGAKEDDYNYVIFDENNANIVGNTRFSLRGSTPYDKQMEEWMEKNNLEKGAVPMEKPIMKEGENIFDYANRMVEWTRNQNLWKTAPKQTGFQDALDKWKADNGLSPDAYPPVRPHREYYSSEIGYAEDLEEYNKKKELWKSAPKPKDFDLSVDLEDMNKQLRNIRRAVLNQKNYDQRTVKAVSDLVRKMLNIGWGDGLSRGKVGNLLSAAKNATGANDVKKYLDKAMGILAENYLNRLSTAYDNLINTKGARADQSGVIKMGSLDAKGQAFMSEYKKAINMDDKSLNNYIANIEEDSAKNEDNVEMNDYRLAGIQAAIMYKQQIGGNDADIAELKKQIGELKNKKDATKEDKDLLKSLEKKLFENKFDRITMYENLLNNIQRMVKESKGRAKEFREEITEHKNEILHRANLDLEGVDSTYYDTTTAKKKLVNNDLQRAVFSSTYTFEQFLKFFGKKAANGEGYLYNYFTKLNQDALDEEQLYNEMNRNALDEKTKELFGKEKFMKLVGIDGKGMKEMDVEVTDYSNKETGKRTIHLKQGQMLYIYLVNKETDGEMKLRAMGITEEDVAAIEENLDPRVKAMGEWLQDEYLPECQRRYQATHTKYFGAPMKDVENYFPLAINNRARNVKEDVNQDSDAMSQLAGTSTGAIVTRRVNVIPLDIENADAFEVAFNHLQEMEEWSAMLPFRQDINTMLSYTHFRNQVQNMSSVAYGSGKTLWDEFKQTAQIAAGTYKPKVNAGMMDSRIAAAMGGIAVAKISGRLWTAIKQSQSATVFLPESDFTRFVKNGVNPYGSWKWAKENIPDFRKRIENITYGDVKLRQYLDELEKYHDWTKVISKWGMAPNILVDGITCAVGARSVYETEVNRLTKLGYPKEKAEEKAYYKAVAAYNKTQQSSGGMYLSPMQVDRTYVSAALSLFKNANYAYGRMQIEACRGLARTYDFWGGKHKTTLIESMTRQIMEEDGLDENTARAIAKATYNRTFRQSIGRLINFATLVPVSWALYKVLPYLLTGDDDDKKKDMIEEAVLKGFATSLSDNYVIPFASNILNAGLKVEDGKPTFDPEVFRYQNLYINPATSDLANIYSMVGNQKWYSVANKLGMLGVQSLIGFNPETVGALYQALSEADYDNGNTAKEWQIGILKAISAPEESIRELYMDELGLKSGDIKKIPLAELEKRYAERQINRDNLLSQIGMDAETFNGYVDKYQKSFEKKIKDKMDKWDEYDKKKADEFFDTTSDHKLKDMIEKKRTKDANAAADEQIAKEGLNQEKKGKEPSEEAYDAVKMSIDVAEDNAISTYNKVLYKRYAALNDEYNNQTDAMKYIFMNKHPNFKAYKDLESEYTTYGKKMKELKEKLVSADGYDAKQTILKQIRAEREKFSELQSKVR